MLGLKKKKAVTVQAIGDMMSHWKAQYRKIKFTPEIMSHATYISFQLMELKATESSVLE